MYWPTEYDERVRVKGFSVLDNEFDFMARDLAGNVGKDPRRNKIGKSLTAILKAATHRWHYPTRLKAA